MTPALRVRCVAAGTYPSQRPYFRVWWSHRDPCHCMPGKGETEVEDLSKGASEQLNQASDQAKDAAGDAMNQAQEAASGAVEQAQRQAQDAASGAMEQAQDAAGNAI